MKKKIVAVLTALSLFSPFVSGIKNAQAAGVFENITFNEFVTGAVPNNIACNSKGNKIEVAPVPSEDEKSVKINTLTTGSDAHIDLSLSTPATGQVVLETSVLVEKLHASRIRVLEVTDSTGHSCRFFYINKNGEVTLSDGTSIFYASEGRFYDMALIIDFDAKTFRIMVAGKTMIYEHPLEKFGIKDVKAIRIQVAETEESATAYVKYLRVYNADHILSPDEYPKVSPQPTPGPSVNVTDSLVKSKFSDNIVMYIGAGKALVNGEIKVIDQENDAKAFISNSSTMVPLRFLSESLGATVTYEGESAYISMGDKIVVVKEGQDTYTLNGELKPLPATPVIVNSRLYVPLRVISEAFGKEVSWDKAGIVIVGNGAGDFLMTGDDGKVFSYVISNLIYERPSSDKIRLAAEENSIGTHPRLMITPKSLDKIKQRISTDSNMGMWFETIRTQADKFLDASLLKHGLTDGVRMLATSKEALLRIKTLGFVYLITNEEKYANRAKEELLNVCSDNFPDWHPWHFLDTAEMSAASAIGFDWLYDKLSDDEKAAVIDSIYKKGLKEVMKDYNQSSDLDRSYNWSQRITNWQAVSNGGLCMAALSILGESEYDDTAYTVIEKGLKHVEMTLGNYFPDGTWYEGQTYWQYMAQYMTYYISCLESALGTSYGLELTPGYARGAYFVISYDGPLGVMNLNNSTAGTANSPQMFYMAKVLGDPTISGHRVGILENLSPSVEDLIWYDPEFSTSGQGLTDGYFRGGQDIIVMRDGFEKTGTYAAIHGSEQTAEHLDSGTYIIDMLGERWILDPGTETQSYYDSNHYQYYKVRAEGHNCVVVNPDRGWDIDPYAPVAIEKYESSSDVSFTILDLSKAYAYKGVTKARRGMMMNKEERAVVVRDEFESGEPTEFYSFMHTEANITLTDDKKGAILSVDGKKIYASLLGDEDLTFEVMEAKALPTSPQPTGGDSTSHLRKLAIHTKDKTSFTAQVSFSPLCADEQEPVFTFEDIPLSSWSIPEKTKEAPKLDYINFGGKPIDGFSPDKTVYEITTKRSLAYAPIEAGGEGDVEVVQSNGENLISRIDIRDKKDSSIKRSYYINFIFMPEFVGIPEDMTEIKVKSVEASYVPQAENHAQNTIDGSFDTRWSSDMLGSYIDYDFGTVQDISFVSMAFASGNARKEMFAIAISEDGENWKEVYTGKNSGTTLDFEGYYIGDRKARFVRVYGYGNALNNWFSMTEFKAFSKK